MQQLQVAEASTLLEHFQAYGQLSSSSTQSQSPSESSESEADPDPYTSPVLDLSYSESVPSPDLPSPQPSSTSSPLALEWEPLSPFHTASPEESHHNVDEQGVMVSKDTTQEQHDVVNGPNPSPWFGFKIVGDNIDKMIKLRYMRCDRQNQSLHYFHMYAVWDRIDLSDSCDTTIYVS